MTFEPLTSEIVVGKTPLMKKVLAVVKRVAATDIPVLILGETGTGKELIARMIHALSARQDKPFVAVNFGAIPENLVETELFGHARGAFTGAVIKKEGLFHRAQGGTFFMDEIGDMPQPLQVKLLRVLERGEVRGVGETENRSVDVRVLAATNRDLWKEVEAGRFREDLFFRLNVVQIYLPPLRDRKEDIPMLIRHFLEQFNRQYEKTIIGFSDETLAILMNYEYPGNVRELENIIQHAVIFSEDNTVGPSDLPPHVTVAKPRLTTPFQTEVAVDGEVPTLEEMEKRLIQVALTRYKGNHTEVAKKLGISRSTLWRKLKHYQLG